MNLGVEVVAGCHGGTAGLDDEDAGGRELVIRMVAGDIW